jgi:hypothetical protein
LVLDHENDTRMQEMPMADGLKSNVVGLGGRWLAYSLCAPRCSQRVWYDCVPFYYLPLSPVNVT